MPNKPQPTIPLAQPNNELKIYPGAIPATPILWPAVQHTSNQVQQTKGSAKPQATGVLPTTQPNQSTVAPRTTPAHVSNVRVVSRNVGGQKNITVQFNHPSGDPYFSGANVYLRSGTKQPVLVASGAKSPLTFTATNDSAPHSIHVTSVGNWGETDVLTSPSAPVKLFGPLNASKTTGTALGTGGGSPTPPPSSGGDGLIHGQGNVDTGSWESDPAYIVMRDDFVRSGTALNAGDTNGLVCGDYNWVMGGTQAGSNAGLLGNTPPYMGTVSWLNSNGASQAGWLLLPSASQSNGTAHAANTWALLENPPWKMTWIFQMNVPQESTSGGLNAFSMANKAMYVGLTGPHNPAEIALPQSRPDVFIGLRYDTSVSPGTLTVTSTTAGSGVATYTGSWTTGGGNGFVGMTFTTAGFTHANNDVTSALCTASSAGSITLVNASGGTSTDSGTATGPAGIGDSFFTLEVVNNPSGSTAGRKNLQGITQVTNVTPVANVWHRLDIICTIVGTVTITLDGSLVNTLTTTMPVSVLTGASAAVTGIITAAQAGFSWTPTTEPLGESPWNGGSIITVSGFTSTQAPLNGTYTLLYSANGFLCANTSAANVASGTSGTVSISGYPSLTPLVMYGGTEVGASEVAAIYVDFFSFIWNPGIGGGTGTAVITNPRYFL